MVGASLRNWDVDLILKQKNYGSSSNSLQLIRKKNEAPSITKLADKNTKEFQKVGYLLDGVKSVFKPKSIFSFKNYCL